MMLMILYNLCLTPLTVLALGWSFTLLTGNLVKRFYGGIAPKWQEFIVKNTEKTASYILKCGLVYLSALLLGVSAPTVVIRWILLGVVMILAMICIVRLGAATEYSIKKLPKEVKSLMIPILLPDIISLICCFFSGYWMIRAFLLTGL